jgi:hypothetical protein
MISRSLSYYFNQHVIKNCIKFFTSDHGGQLYEITTRESGICPWPNFSLIPDIFAPGINVLICTGWSHRPVQMASHMGTSGPPSRHPIQMPHICTGWWLRPVRVRWPHIYTG